MNPRKEKFLKIAKSDPLRLKTYGFVHIPKTGGTSINKFSSQVMRAGGKFPVSFPHGWTVEQILKQFPKMKLCFIIRDPLERTISGINSRLRMGRPQYNSVWDLGEAISFNYFPTALDIFNGLGSKDERIKSAAIFAMKNISHIKHGYEFYFKSPEAVRLHASSFTIVRDITDSDAFARSFCDEVGIPRALLDEHYKRMHVAPQSTRGFINSMPAETLAQVRKHLAKEYAIYEELKLVASNASNA